MYKTPYSFLLKKMGEKNFKVSNIYCMVNVQRKLYNSFNLILKTI